MRALSLASSTTRTANPFLLSMAVLLLALPAQAQLAPPNEAGVTFSHIHLAVADMDLHKSLWTELFGGELVEKGGYAAIRVPGTLIFLRNHAPTAPSQATSMDHIGFKVRDLDTLLAKWQRLGYDVDQDASDMQDAPSSYITMPNGTRVELIEAPDLSVTAAMDHVHFFSSQPRELMAWYVDLFDAGLQGDGPAELSAFTPGSALLFSHTEQERLPTDSTAVDHIGFEIGDMDAFAKMLQGKGVEFTAGPFYVESLDLWVAFFPDPSGVLVEISEGLDRY